MIETIQLFGFVEYTVFEARGLGKASLESWEVEMMNQNRRNEFLSVQNLYGRDDEWFTVISSGEHSRSRLGNPGTVVGQRQILRFMEWGEDKAQSQGLKFTWKRFTNPSTVFYGLLIPQDVSRGIIDSTYTRFVEKNIRKEIHKNL